MLHSGRFTALLDANVLYPAPLRDYMLNLASMDLYKPKWTSEIQKEWIVNLLEHRTDLKKEQLDKTRAAMDAAFPDANITNYEELIEGLSLPDKNDNHVLAAAIKAKADVIITFNLKDFPAKYLGRYDIEPQHPDVFIENLIHLDAELSMKALDNQVKRLKNPPKTKSQILDKLRDCGLTHSAKMLRD